MSKLPQEEKENFLGGKAKAALYDAGILAPEDYFKILKEIAARGIIVPGQKCLNHSTLGDFKEASTKYPNGRLSGGGHLQESMVEMQKRGIVYNVTRTAENGVRFGNVPSHVQTFKRTGEMQTWFPKDWTRQDVLTAGCYVANRGSSVKRANSTSKEALWKGVNVRCLFDKEDGRVSTICPSYNQ